MVPEVEPEADRDVHVDRPILPCVDDGRDGLRFRQGGLILGGFQVDLGLFQEVPDFLDQRNRFLGPMDVLGHSCCPWG